ncbi:oxidation resistance protein 1, partial [Lunasporangiospora selenospora]
MIPRKTKQTLSLVTTEQSHHGGPARSTQTTVHTGDWGERSARSGTTSTSDSQRPPNSATSPNQDPWMLVTGSGSATATPFFSTGNDAIARLQPNNNGSSSSIDSVPTPTLTREEQVNKLPPLQLLDRYDDSDPVLDVDIAAQIRLELPRRLRNATKWSLVYSSDQHGISMSTLFHR